MTISGDVPQVDVATAAMENAPANAQGEQRRCGWCRHALPERSGRGRPRLFCSQRCRQWDWVARQRAAELALSDDQLVVARTALDELHDDLYVLACAVADTERDIADGLELAEAVGALRWLLDAAKPLAARRIGAG